MSSAAPAPRPRVSPARELVERARLRAVPRLRSRRTAAPKVPFIALVSMLLIGGVVGLLMFNTSMQQAAFSEASLQQQADNLAAREQGLQQKLQQMNDPQRVAEKAQAEGMVMPGDPVLISVPSGHVQGTPAPANRDNTPALQTANPKPYVAPQVTKTTTPPATATKTAAKTATKTTTKTTATSAAKGARKHAKKAAPKTDGTQKKTLPSDASQGD